MRKQGGCLNVTMTTNVTQDKFHNKETVFTLAKIKQSR